MGEDEKTGKFLFVLLSFLSLFPEGILLNDFVQFVTMPNFRMEYAPQNWISPLIKLSLLSSTLEEDNKGKLRSLDQQVASLIMSGTSPASPRRSSTALRAVLCTMERRRCRRDRSSGSQHGSKSLRLDITQKRPGHRASRATLPLTSW